MFSARIHRYIFLVGLFCLGFGMMVGTVPTSIPQIILAANWVLELHYAEKLRRLARNPLFWVLSAVFLLHLIGLIYTTDMQEGLKDVRIKIPLIFLPFLFLSAEPIKLADLRGVLKFFILGTVVNTVWCLFYSFVLHNQEVVRNASRFMSHIRLGLYLNMAIACCIYFARQYRRIWRVVYLIIAGYLVLVMMLLGMGSGLAFLVLLGCAFVLYQLFTGKRRLAMITLTCLILVTGSSVWYVLDVAKTQLTPQTGMQNQPQVHTVQGNLFFHFAQGGQMENGYYVLMNIQQHELSRCWSREFPTDSFRFSPEHNIQRYEVLIRYMSSKGLLKDSAGYAKLSDHDKELIRKGYTNYLQPDWNFLRKRTYELVNDVDEYLNGRRVSGHSLSMRLYFWKAAMDVISRYPLLGAGTGDVQLELNASYIRTSSPLSAEWRKRPHNQYLTMWVALGLLGFLAFIISLVYPIVKLRRALHTLYWPFLLLALASFVFEDTLETQAGVTFYAFFNSLFVCEAWLRTRQTPGDSPVNR